MKSSPLDRDAFLCLLYILPSDHWNIYLLGGFMSLFFWLCTVIVLGFVLVWFLAGLIFWVLISRVKISFFVGLLLKFESWVYVFFGFGKWKFDGETASSVICNESSTQENGRGMSSYGMSISNPLNIKLDLFWELWFELNVASLALRMYGYAYFGSYYIILVCIFWYYQSFFGGFEGLVKALII